MKIAIIADDLTSAADAGVYFVRRGYRATVSLFPNSLIPKDMHVVAVDTDSRAQSPQEAEKRIRTTVRQLKTQFQIIYKTIDSTLRGHLATEISATLEESGKRTAIIAPAFPMGGRVTREGVQLLSGRPIHETEFASDPTHPVKTSDISTLLQGSGLEPIMTIKRDHLGRPDYLRQLVASARSVVVDSETNEDLAALVAAISDLTSVCWVGSPGLARALAGGLAATDQRSVPHSQCQKILVVAGSVNPVTRSQVASLLLRKDAAAVNGPIVGSYSETGTNSTLEILKKHFHEKRILVLSSKNVRESVTEAARESNMNALAEIASVAVKNGLVNTLILTGGATALAVLERSGIKCLDLLDELAPGIPMARGTAGHHELTVVTKAGGFGSSDALGDLCNDLLAIPLETH